MNKKKVVISLEDLKCNERTPWNTIEVHRQSAKKYTIAKRIPRVRIDHSAYDTTAGRQSKLLNPYSQVWSFLARFDDIAPDIKSYLPNDIATAAARVYNQTLQPFRPKKLREFSQHLDSLPVPRNWTGPHEQFTSHACAFGLMVALLKRYYASLFFVVGLGESYRTLTGCDEMDRAETVGKRMATEFQTHTIPLFIASVVWSQFVGEALFGRPYGPVIMRAWTGEFLLRSVDRVMERRKRARNQRLAVQQGNLDIVRFAHTPLDLVNEYQITLLPRDKLTMPAPIPYIAYDELQTGWKNYIKKHSDADLKSALGFSNATRVSYEEITFQNCIERVRSKRPTAKQIASAVRGKQSMVY